MPNLTIDINDARIATIDLTTMRLANVAIHGTLDREPKAVLDATGGTYDGSATDHLLWIVDQALSPGDVVRVSLHANDATCDPGKTIAQMYPDEEPCTRNDFSISADMAAEIRARPRLHAGFAVQASTSSGAQASAGGDERNTDVRFSLAWENGRPEQARVRLSTYCLDDVLARQIGTEHLATTIATGEYASFTLVR